MTTSGKPLIYWDACVLLAWLREEKRPNPADMEGVARVVEALDRDEIRLVTSVLSQLEVLPSSLSQEQEQKFKGVLKRADYFHQASITGPIITTARTIRDSTRQNQQTIGTPDAIHLATAIVLGASKSTRLTEPERNPRHG